MSQITPFPGCCAVDVLSTLPYKLEGDTHSVAYKKLIEVQIEIANLQGKKALLAIALPLQCKAMEQLGFEVIATVPSMYGSRQKLYIMCKGHEKTTDKEKPVTK